MTILANSQVPARDHDGFYTHPFTDLRVPSVTTVIGILNKPALPASAAKLCSTFAVTEQAKWRDLSRTEAIDLVKASYRREWNHKMWRGSAVHKAIELVLLGEPIPDVMDVLDRGEVVACFERKTLLPYIAQFEAFRAAYQPVFFATEIEVWNHTQAYAGKLDLDVHMAGHRMHIDVKTGDSGVWPESALQLAAYAHSETLLDRNTASEEELVHPEFAAVLHLQPKFFNLVRVDISEDTFRTFLYARELWWWNRERAKAVLGLPLPAPELSAPELAPGPVEEQLQFDTEGG